VVINPPAHPRHAFDIVAVESARLFRRDLLETLTRPIEVTESPGWGRPVHAPVDGVVVAAHDGVPDRTRVRAVPDMIATAFRGGMPFGDMASVAGNHVVVRCEAGDVLLAHLRRGSVRVRAGDRVTAGQVVGDVGNSGNSVAPHLHLQLSAPRGRLPWARVLPFKVRAYEQWTGGRWTLVRDAPLPRIARVRPPDDHGDRASASCHAVHASPYEDEPALSRSRRGRPQARD
jgi:peptidase M23-like protein